MRRNGSKRVAEAVAEWRAADCGETLSGRARDRILRSVADGGSASQERAVASLFLPFGRLVLAGAAPVMLVAVLLGWMALPRGVDPAAPAGSEAAVAVHVSKQGGDVVFVLENGGRPHRVTRSTSPENGGESMGVVHGSFRDELTGGADLVFYRID